MMRSAPSWHAAGNVSWPQLLQIYFSVVLGQHFVMISLKKCFNIGTILFVTDTRFVVAHNKTTGFVCLQCQHL